MCSTTWVSSRRQLAAEELERLVERTPTSAACAPAPGRVARGAGTPRGGRGRVPGRVGARSPTSWTRSSGSRGCSGFGSIARAPSRSTRGPRPSARPSTAPTGSARVPRCARRNRGRPSRTRARRGARSASAIARSASRRRCSGWTAARTPITPLERAIAIEPAMDDGCYVLGRAYQAAGRHRSAQRAFATVERLRTERPR